MKMVDKGFELGIVSGSWIKSIRIDEKEIWNINIRPLKHYCVLNPLPSDLRFREDLIWLFYENKKIAQKWKLRLEER